MLGLSPANVTSIILGLLILLGYPAVYFFGKRQDIGAKRDADKIAAENAAKANEVAEENAKTQLFNAAALSGEKALQTLLNSAATVQTLLETVQKQAQEIAALRLKSSEDIGNLRLRQQEEINTLREQVLILTGQVEMLRNEIAVKDAALAGYDQMRAQKTVLEKEIAALHLEIEDYRRASSAYLFLWQAAAEQKGDAGMVNVAEQSIMRILQATNKPIPAALPLNDSAPQIGEPIIPTYPGPESS